MFLLALLPMLAKIWKNLGKIYNHPNPHGYIMKICVSSAYNIIQKKLRKISLEKSIAVNPPEAVTNNCVREIEDSEIEQQILDAIASLPRKQAESVLMRLVDDQSYELIAGCLGCSVATARAHVSKGRSRLREVLSHLYPTNIQEAKS